MNYEWHHDEPKRNGSYIVRTNKNETYVAKYRLGIGWCGKFHNSVIAWGMIPKYEEQEKQ